MAEISASLVKELREKTGAGMMDCKKALTEAGGDLEAAVDWLRAKGLAAATKKAGRTAAEGLVGVATGANTGAVVEVNSETDFVAKNEQFQGFVRTTAGIALEIGGDVDVILAASYPGEPGPTVKDQITHNIATIGENQSLRRAAQLSVSSGLVASYVHNAAGDGLGKIGVLVALESPAPASVLETLGKQLAMHVAAAAPVALDETGVDPSLLARERDIAIEKARTDGKPENLLEKIADGAVAKFKKDNTLVNQLFVMDGKTPVKDVVAQAAKEIGQPVALTGFVRFQLGEGIEKAATDFAAEVAAAAGR
ncbi:MAG: elongation factor Ts [Sphingomonadales bacterium]|nr:MAG: elongation factor Ts [Sphingomonadales bacterium]